jgi:hypothetical protein
MAALRCMRRQPIRLLSSRTAAQAPTDAQIDEINNEIAEFFGQTPPSSSSPFTDRSPMDDVQVFIDRPSASSATRPQVVDAAHNAYDGRSASADKAAADATISQLRERVQFLEKLVEQLVASPARTQR